MSSATILLIMALKDFPPKKREKYPVMLSTNIEKAKVWINRVTKDFNPAV